MPYVLPFSLTLTNTLTIFVSLVSNLYFAQFHTCFSFPHTIYIKSVHSFHLDWPTTFLLIRDGYHLHFVGINPIGVIKRLVVQT